jgi:anthranilate phosphoribosyltransferase
VNRGEEFLSIIKERARGPGHLGNLDPALCERAMELILAGKATPAQIGGFLLVGRAVGDEPPETSAYARAMRAFIRQVPSPEGAPVIAVTGGFDGKLRTLNVGAAASLVAAAAGGRTILLGCEGTPPKEGRTHFAALRRLGLHAPQKLEEAEASFDEHGFAAVSTRDYLPELAALLPVRREMVRRTVLNVVEKLVSPVPGCRFAVGITHRPFLVGVSKALVELGVDRALVYGAIEGSDEAPLDGISPLALVSNGGFEELRVDPDSIGLGRATRADIPWQGEEDEAWRLLEALSGEEGPVRDLILYNAALRLWTADGSASLRDHAERALEAVLSGEALHLLWRLGGRVPVL